MSVQEDFWRDVRQLSCTIGAPLPLDRDRATALIADFSASTPEVQRQMKDQLRILIARLMQIERHLTRSPQLNICA